MADSRLEKELWVLRSRLRYLRQLAQAADGKSDQYHDDSLPVAAEIDRLIQAVLDEDYLRVICLADVTPERERKTKP